MHKNNIKKFQKKLLSWYENEFRDLPWRRTSEPYAVWLSEIMLQQTQVKKVTPYYERFIEALPTIASLASADLDDVLKLWEGLGYYARARNLQKGAKMIVEKFGGHFPTHIEDIRNIPGIGPYTAAAIASIAFGEDLAVVDGNVNRVLGRLFALPLSPKTGEGHKVVVEKAEMLLAHGQAGDYNQAVMELGAMICAPRSPKCEMCPVSEYCTAFAENTQQNYPVRLPSKKRPHRHIAVGVVWKDDHILIDRRKKDDMLGGLWEFPGGKVEAGETYEQTVVREVNEELDIEVKVLQPIGTIEHQYSHFTITMHAFHCAHVSGDPKAIECDDWRWINPSQLKDFAFPRANGKIIELLMNEKALPRLSDTRKAS
jgi:A/G-specific adenine glycosylase